MFSDIMKAFLSVEATDFEDASSFLINKVNNATDFLDILTQIGTIPESLEPDSTAEKLYSKVSDAVLARAFREIGLKATVLKERGDSADVLAESSIHGYTLVADAKAFRLSRTAKNQKDFKVSALSGWRKDHDYAVLCAPYFQYPTRSSQIYSQALEDNVCLFSWEHLVFLVANGIKENEHINFSHIWNYGEELASQTVLSQKKRCFITQLNKRIFDSIGQNESAFNEILSYQIRNIESRAITEKGYWQEEILAIHKFTRERAIAELIKCKKIQEKIAQIEHFVKGLKV